MFTLKSLFIFCLCFGWLIFLKPEAQVGIFKGVPSIYVSTGKWSIYDKSNGFTFKERKSGKKIKLPWSSIAYIEYDSKEKQDK